MNQKIKQEAIQNQTRQPVVNQNIQPTAPVVTPSNVPKNKVTLVKFDQNTDQPFEVKFSKRGFSVDGTRLSFELLDQALSKNFSITLNGGTGLVLTPVRMQKIMKYRDLY